MTDTDFKEVAKFQFESAQARSERINTKMFVLCILLIILLVVSNGLWIYYICATEIEQITICTQEVDTGNGNAYLMDGIHIGESKADSCYSKKAR